ncbi:flagellar biosynthetic protein FliQ [Neorhodopirellula lusitana]|uniref:Flagellar biosynthetic protein FliQ n=1 Tax=Neorhodopirellula lusitana TaxID=445327 RepID=A0ABY1QSX1_9BACT|nr:flagellar biosynthesis protein FliQ [Neorhodopirellula lusitana]SMP76842.1 flagellar biosynthetic protein FliQ [Neorhodopirellula lusitana]
MLLALLDSSAAIDLAREALLVAVVMAAPMLIVGMAAGLIIGLIQALTQIQDQTVSFVPKLLAMAAVLVACLPWLMTRMLEFTRSVFENAGGL